jgi:Tol biopolymer transport system component
MKKVTLSLIVIVCIAAAEQPAVAIIEFEAKNCDQGIADAVGEILRTEIIATGKYRVIERAQLARVMEEHAFQLSGLVDASTVAELGKLVGADYVAVGSVSGLGGTYTMAVRFIDVETAEAALGRTETARDEAGLPDVCRRLASALTGLPYSGSSTYTGSTPSYGGGGRIAFISDRDGNPEIFVIDADGGNQTQLTNNTSDDWEPAWSPDGRRIAFSSDRDGDKEIFVMDADGDNQTQLTNNTSWDSYPAWSPDGRRIAFISGRDGDWEIFVMDADGGNQRQLTTGGGRYPAWSPDGRRIAFISDRDGNPEIFVIDADGRNKTQLTTQGGWSPAWSPDGRRIAFQSKRDGNPKIFVMDADGGNQRQLTFNTSWDSYPAWSPDGRRIAFSSDRTGDSEIFVMDADGRNQTQLTFNTSGDWDPAWCPVQ